MQSFGKLEPVDIKSGWPGEASHFTPWLASDEGLTTLGTEIGLELELIQTEFAVGSFRADILAKPIGSDECIVIENQYGKTDHCHLGQLLTYAAGGGTDGSGAKTIIWVAQEFTEPHRAALDWLNSHTDKGIAFFGIEIQLWQIGDSPLAPKLNVVSRPNDWQKQQIQETAAMSQANRLYEEFWTGFLAFCETQGKSFALPVNAPTNYWFPIRLGIPGFGVRLIALKKTKSMECQLWVAGAKASSRIEALLLKRDQVSAALGSQVKFDGKAANEYLIYEHSSKDITVRENWPAMFQWLRERGEEYVRVFTPLLRELEIP